MDTAFWRLMKHYPAPEHHSADLWRQERKLRLRRYCFYLMGYRDHEIPESEEEQVVLFQQVKYSWRNQRDEQRSLREVAEMLDTSTTTLRHYCTLSIGRDVWELQFESLFTIAPVSLPPKLRVNIPDYMRHWNAYDLHYWLTFGVEREVSKSAEFIESWEEPGINWPLVQTAIEQCPWSLEELDTMADALEASGKVEWGSAYFSRLMERQISVELLAPNVEATARFLMIPAAAVTEWIKEPRLIY